MSGSMIKLERISDWSRMSVIKAECQLSSIKTYWNCEEVTNYLNLQKPNSKWLSVTKK